MKIENHRVKYIDYFFLSLFVVVSLRIVYLQVFKRTFFQDLAKGQYYRHLPIEGRRGKIFDRKGRILATSINSYSVFVDPGEITSPNLTASILSYSLGIPKEEILNKFSKKKNFVWLKRKISWQDKERIKKLNLKGVGFIRESKRFYPQENLAGPVIGLVDIDNKGIEGLEFYYDNYLRGKSGLVRVLYDSLSREVFITPQIISPKEGDNIVLTIDAQIQYWAEKYLFETISKFSALEGSVVVMKADTGEILAMANYPTFNPNRVDSNFYGSKKRNIAVCDSFEPGSVFKIVTLLAGIEGGIFSDEDKIFCENGKFKIPGSILNDWKPYGFLTFKEVFKKSSNIGVAKIANSLGKSIIYNYIKRLGFGTKTGIDFPAEASGKIKPLNLWSNTSSYIIPIGHEVSTNLIRLVLSFATIVNGGYLVKPHLVKNINSKFIYKDIPIERKKIFSKDITDRAKKILIEVVQEGTGILAKIDGITIGGKTGTAQQFDIKLGKYSPTDYRATFIGFIDDSNFPLVIGVSINRPQKSHFGGVVAAPLFRKVAEKTIKYLQIEKTITKNSTES